MPIHEVRAQAVAVPLDRTIATPVGTFSHHHVVVASVAAGDNVGSFYAWTLSERETAVLRDMTLHVGSHLLGHDAGEIALNLRRMHTALRLTGRTGVGGFATGLIDTCLWDLKGKAAGMPLWRLLGGSAAAPIPAYASALFLSQSLEELREEARAFREAGFRWVKMRVGKSEEEDLRRIELVRNELGDGIELMLDAVMSWDIRTAVQRARAYSRFSPFWLEDPVDYREGAHLEALAAVRRDSPVRITAGEFLFNPEGFRDMIRTEAVDLLMVDMQHVGGVSPWLDVLALARQAAIGVVPHVFPELAMHMHCIDGSVLPIEYVSWTLPLFADVVEPEDGCFRVPTQPGLGCTFAWDRVADWALGPALSVRS